MNWRVKAAAFRMLDLVPYGAELHYHLQRRFTKTLPGSPEQLDSYWDAAKSILSDWAKHKSSLHPAEVLEIGAGRDLAAPLALTLMGVARVVASDVARLARIDLVRHAVCHMARRAGRDAPQFDTWAELAGFGVTYRAPDIVTAPYPDTFDCSCSTTVLEHVPSGQLPGLLRGLKAATRPGGLSIHFIDYSDHYARSDTSLSRFNFLKFSERQWAKYNSGLQHVNRLRHGDYLKLFRAAGFTIAEERSILGEPMPEIRSNLAPAFRAYSERDLFSLAGYIVAVA
jgi:hypothetical protein